MFNYCFAIDLLLSLLVEKNENPLAFGEIRGKVEWHIFFGTRCSTFLVSCTATSSSDVSVSV